jgi:aspartate/methionine/tyrosine aminotransferase
VKEMFISKRVQAIKPSPTLAIDAKAKALKQQGVDVISFGAGEPDFNTPQNIKDSGIDAINKNFTRLTIYKKCRYISSKHLMTRSTVKFNVLSP